MAESAGVGWSEVVATADDVGSGEREIGIEDEQEDPEPMKHAINPGDPTPEEIEQHRLDHYPYRAWCRWCVMGRGLGQQHSRVDRSSTIPRVGIDYYFITKDGVALKDEMKDDGQDMTQTDVNKGRKDGSIVKCLIVRCWDTKCVFTHVVPCKGNDEEQYVANLVVSDIEWMGHARVIIKHDNEPALTAFARQVIVNLKSQGTKIESATSEQPPKYDSQAAGGTEIGIRAIRAMFRTMKACLESRLGKAVPIDHCIVPWLLEHVTLILNTRARGDDGRTPWHRVRGRAFAQRVLGFGESILFKHAVKDPKTRMAGNMSSKWSEGVFLGYNRNANTYIVATGAGVVYPRSLMRTPFAERWKHEAIAGVRATPWSLSGST